MPEIHWMTTRKSRRIAKAASSRSPCGPQPPEGSRYGKAYVEELDRLLSHVSTFSARRERIFIEQRLTSVKSDLQDAERQFSQFASKNTALDIKEQTKAMVESAACSRVRLLLPSQNSSPYDKSTLLITYACGPCRHASMNSSGRPRRWVEQMIRFSRRDTRRSAIPFNSKIATFGRGVG